MLVLWLFVVLAALFITVLNSKTAQQLSIGGQTVNSFTNTTVSSTTTIGTDEKTVADTPPAKTA